VGAYNYGNGLNSMLKLVLGILAELGENDIEPFQ